MDRIIGVATGSIWQWKRTPNRGELISHLRDLPIRAAELTMGSVEETFCFSLREDDRDWLRGLSFVSIHAPSFASVEGNRQKTERLLLHLSTIYHEIGAQAIVFHPYDMEDFSICSFLGMRVSVENMSPQNEYPIGGIWKILDSDEEFSLCLDTVHAWAHSEEEIERYVNHVTSKISHVHISARINGKDHSPLIEGDPVYIKALQESVGRLSCPVLIEESFSPYDREGLYREVLFVSSLFSSIE